MKRKLLYLRSRNPKEYWKILNSDCTKKRCDVELSELYNYYKERCNKEIDGGRNHVLSEEELKVLSDLELNECINEPITHDEVMKCLGNLKNNKASGQDKIVNEYLKASANTMLNFYVILFNKILDTGIIPSQWTLIKGTPLIKKITDQLL